METIETIGKSWWKLLLRGILAVLFGLLTFAMPELTFGLLALLFGLFILADGIVEIGYAFSSRDWWMLIPGFLGIAIGVLAVFYLEITAFVLLLIIAAWAITRGVFDIVTAIQLRKQISGEGLLILGGVLSILVGLAITVFPTVGAVAMVWLIGAYAFVSGVIMIATAFRIHARANKVRRSLLRSGQRPTFSSGLSQKGGYRS